MTNTNDDLTCVDFEKDIWVKFDTPNVKSDKPGLKLIRNLTEPPYVFIVDKITLIDAKHPQGVVFKNIKVLFMHGGKSPMGPWMMNSREHGYPLIETTRYINSFLREKNDSPVRISVACNEEENDKDMDGKSFPAEEIIYAVGENVVLKVTTNEKSEVEYKLIANTFWNLDRVLMLQNIEVL